LSIFYYIFSEATYAFFQKDNKKVTSQVQTNIQNTGTNTGSGDSKPESYGSEQSSNSNKPESYNPDDNPKDNNKPEEYNPDNSTVAANPSVDKPEEYKPESYGGDEPAKQPVKMESKDVKKTGKKQLITEKKQQDTIKKQDVSSLEAGRIASQSSESAGGDKTITFGNLFFPNDVINGKKRFIWQPVSEVPKFSLVPLAVGALKVTLIGLLIAAPIAILAAIFTTAFAPKWLREIMKPSIEILAGFPSVVIGFFCLITISSVIQSIFGTVYRLNSFVGGIGMALAVIPIIYTVTEDALAAIPKLYKEASLALGASRWQTTFRVILPAATPGVFAAIILGFGRAFGETMIALMATGNAALTSWDIFESVRTLSATIGAEMAEVDFHGVHYGILFLIGALLFIVTFSLNAIAEFWVRKKLLKKFQGL